LKKNIKKCSLTFIWSISISSSNYMVNNYQIAFISYTIMAILNLSVVLFEIDTKEPNLITIIKMVSDVGLHFVVAYVYYNEWTKSSNNDNFKNLRKLKNA